MSDSKGKGPGKQLGKLKDKAFAAPQYVLPQHSLSKVINAATRLPAGPIKNVAVKGFTKAFKINMDEAAESNSNSFRSFNEFFTRELKPGARPMDPTDGNLVSPADGRVSQAGDIVDGKLIQAKGMDFAVEQLLAGSKAMSAPYKGGQFATIYLSPRDYHRVHMPCAGKLKEMVHVPGKLFSVNALTARSVPRLFARNERVICRFETEFGEMVMILVGAIFVSSMETVWHGVVNTGRHKTIREWNYDNENIQLARGAEMGRFNMGSTVIVLLPPNAPKLAPNVTADTPIQMGNTLALSTS